MHAIASGALSLELQWVSVAMRGGQDFTEAAALIEFVPATFTQALELGALFSNQTAPLEVDLGCGGGSFLTALAAQRQNRNFLGVERLLGRARGSCRRIAHLELTNARIIRAEILTTVRYLLPPRSVDAFYLMFPDPWPKRRHHRRRVFTRPLLESLHVALKPDGVFQIATDQREYFTEMLETVSTSDLFRADRSAALPELPRSTFEERFVKAGNEIHRLVLRKLSG